MELQELTKMVEELWFNYKFTEIWNYLHLPISIFELIAMYKINQVLKIYINENEKFLK